MADRYVVPRGLIIMIPSQPFFAFFPLCWVLTGEETTTIFIVFDFIQSGLEHTIYANRHTTDEHTIYRTRGEHANRHTTDEHTIYRTRGEHANRHITDEHTIYRTRGEHANRHITDAVVLNVNT